MIGFEGFKPSQSRQNMAGVIGNPISHSLSPFIHQFWLKQARTEGFYQAFGPQNDDEFKLLIKVATDQNWAGFNITSPYKRLAFSLADYHSQSALNSSSANLLCFDHNKKIWAHSTDGYGMGKAFETVIKNFSFSQKKVVIVGAGGAAQAAISYILDHGAIEIRMINRSLGKLSELKKSDSRVKIYGFEDYQKGLDGAEILISCLPVDIDWDLSKLTKNAIVFDMRYRPLKTPLLKRAKEGGYQTVDGLWMLIHQARPSFCALFGIDEPDPISIRKALIEQFYAELYV
jgi:shikimate dehydrogenase